MASSYMTNEELESLDNIIYYTINQIKKNRKRPDKKAIYNKIIKLPEYDTINEVFLNDRIDVLVTNGILINKFNHNQDSFDVNNQIIGNDSVIEFSHQDISVHSIINTLSPLSSKIPLNDVSPPLSLYTPDDNNNSKNLESHNLIDQSNNTVDSISDNIDALFNKAKLLTFKESIMEELRDYINQTFESHISKSKPKQDDSLYLKEIVLLNKELDSKNKLISQLMETIKVLSINNRQKSSPIHSCESSEIEANSAISSGDIMNEAIDRFDNENTLSNEEAILKQLETVKLKKKLLYYEFKKENNEYQYPSAPISLSEKNHQTIIVGDSILNGIIENKLNNDNNHIVKVKKLPGARVDNVLENLPSITESKPSCIIIHAATNDSVSCTSREILDKLLKLKHTINDQLPLCKVLISTPTLQFDNSKASLVNNELINHLLELKIDIVDNRNIIKKNIGYKGLDLNFSGSSRLASNFLKVIKNN